MELQKVVLNVEELEQRIAPDSINGVPGESNGNPGNEVSNGAKPQPGSHTATRTDTDVMTGEGPPQFGATFPGGFARGQEGGERNDASYRGARAAHRAERH